MVLLGKTGAIYYYRPGERVMLERVVAIMLTLIAFSPPGWRNPASYGVSFLSFLLLLGVQKDWTKVLKVSTFDL